jgi:hypothetical protein
MQVAAWPFAAWTLAVCAVCSPDPSIAHFRRVAAQTYLTDYDPSSPFED